MLGVVIRYVLCHSSEFFTFRLFDPFACRRIATLDLLISLLAPLHSPSCSIGLTTCANTLNTPLG